MKRTLALLLVLVVSCTAKDDTQQVTENTPPDVVTCVLDSKPWQASSDGSNNSIKELTSAEIGEWEGRKTLTLTAWRILDNEVTSISIYAEDIGVRLKIPLYDGAQGRATFSKKSPEMAKASFVASDAQFGGSMTIEMLDTVNHRVKGNFAFSLEGVKVDSGRFDTRYQSPAPL